MVIFLQRTFTSSVNAHAGRTQGQSVVRCAHWDARKARAPLLLALGFQICGKEKLKKI